MLGEVDVVVAVVAATAADAEAAVLEAAETFVEVDAEFDATAGGVEG